MLPAGGTLRPVGVPAPPEERFSRIEDRGTRPGKAILARARCEMGLWISVLGQNSLRGVVRCDDRPRLPALQPGHKKGGPGDHTHIELGIVQLPILNIRALPVRVYWKDQRSMPRLIGRTWPKPLVSGRRRNRDRLGGRPRICPAVEGG